MSAPQEILRLVAQFQQNLDSYKSGQYNEAQLRREFLDPFFKALGWDMDNTQGLAEAYKDVVNEDAIRIGGAVKAPDYCFRIGGTRKFFLEAKKPSVAVGGETSAAYQLRRYAWSAKLPLSILSDFEELAVYDCRIKPNRSDSASTARVFICRFQDYPERWDWIASIFSKDAILKGSFDKYAEANKAKRGTAEVDDDFLATIERWRSELARNLALRNPRLSQRELNFAVQRIIDRMIFLRICEDRGIELYGRLLALTNGPNIYPLLCEIFEDADDKYNSGLFYFQAEKGRHEPPDEITLGLNVDDKLLHDLLRGLYYPESPYEFTVLSADILGQVYEQFLGKVIRLTAAHHAVIEDKPEVKKAGGVYYTPTYIVDYIVRQTVGKLVEGKTPRQIGNLRVLDPACGSGSFLINAYQFLLDWHHDWYLAHDPGRWAKGRNPILVQTTSGWKLTIAERKRILLGNIYGVDIDPQAVEVTKLSLLLKVLEGENEQTIQPYLRLFQQRALPDLGENIKCGNSLIEPDFYQQKELPSLSDEDRLRINVFDWDAEFKEIMKSGGFDTVIGNPPYIRMEGFKELKNYLKAKYISHDERSDLYIYFIERSHLLLKEKGRYGMIVSNKFLRANYGRLVRDFLRKSATVNRIVDLAGLPVFKGATVRTIILLTSRGVIGEKGPLYIGIFPPDIFQKVAGGTLTIEQAAGESAHQVSLKTLTRPVWSFARREVDELLNQLKERYLPLAQYCEGQILMGIKSGLTEAFVIDDHQRAVILKRNSRAEEIIKPFINGRDVRRYNIEHNNMFVIYTYHGVDISRYPAVEAHLMQYKDRLQKRATRQAWFELQQPQFNYAPFMNQPKIVFPDIATAPRFSLDEKGYYCSNTTYFIPLHDLYLLGILNSDLGRFYFENTCAGLEGKNDKYLRFFGQYLDGFPVRQIDPSARSHVALRNSLIGLVGKMLEFHKQLCRIGTPHEHESLQRQVSALDKQIDHIVYHLYSLTPEEIRIVEGSD
jgi:hypothetical protein